MTVLAFPVKQSTVPADAREFADKVEDGEFGKIDAAIVITSGAGLNTHYWGEGMNLVDAIGILETAKYHLVKRLTE